MSCIFLFHRDLRLEDHLPLQEALDSGLDVLPVFIFTPEQVGTKAPIRSLMSCACLLQSLEELNTDLRKHFKTHLITMYGDNIECLKQLEKDHKDLKAIYETKDYTPYAKKREARIAEFCTEKGLEFYPIDYLYLFAPGEILNKSGKPFQKFASFYEVASHRKIDRPLGLVKTTKGKFKALAPKGSSFKFSTTLTKMRSMILKGNKQVENRYYKGGRKEALDLLGTLPDNYNKTHNRLDIETSGLSVHHHYGTIGVRESYEAGKAIKNSSEFIRQLFWRDFYGHIMDYFEELYGTDAIEFWKKNNEIKSVKHPVGEPPALTKEQEKIFQSWCDGKTGVELVDACMNQMNETGYMHNRGRLLVSSWLIKDMGIPWRYGERYFAERLLDYDLTQNMMNWIFQASILPFSTAPFRRIDPERTAKDFDPEGKYLEDWS